MKVYCENIQFQIVKFLTKPSFSSVAKKFREALSLLKNTCSSHLIVKKLKKIEGTQKYGMIKLYSECNVIISCNRWNKSEIFKSLLKYVSHSQQFSLQFNSKSKDKLAILKIYGYFNTHGRNDLFICTSQNHFYIT